jgi:hypothetical protein
VKLRADDLFGTPLDQAQIDFENEGGETYICSNPPYQGSVNQNKDQKRDKDRVLGPRLSSYKDLDYVACWFAKSSEYMSIVDAEASLVATNSICQGEQVAMLWPFLFSQGVKITFAHTSFKWSNNAAYNAASHVLLSGLGNGQRATLSRTTLSGRLTR